MLVQTYIPSALCALHNFILWHDPDDIGIDVDEDELANLQPMYNSILMDFNFLWIYFILCFIFWAKVKEYQNKDINQSLFFKKKKKETKLNSKESTQNTNYQKLKEPYYITIQ